MVLRGLLEGANPGEARMRAEVQLSPGKAMGAGAKHHGNTQPERRQFLFSLHQDKHQLPSKAEMVISVTLHTLGWLG